MISDAIEGIVRGAKVVIVYLVRLSVYLHKQK